MRRVAGGDANALMLLYEQFGRYVASAMGRDALDQVATFYTCDTMRATSNAINHYFKPSYGYVLPRQVKKQALVSALSLRASEGKLVVVDNFATDGKTKSVASALKALGGGKSLIVDAKTNDKLQRGAKNLPKSQWLAPEGINVYDIMRHDTLILTQDAVKAVTEQANA